MFHLRWPNGFVCPKCGNQFFYPIKRRHTYQCTACRHQASVTAGTIMDKTHITLEKWFWAIYLVSTDKRGHSALALSKELGIGYKAAWYLLHRIRTAMMERDWDCMLSGIVEIDDAFFGAPDEGGKRGRGTAKTKVIVGLSVSEEKRPRFLKMEIAKNLKSDSIVAFAEANIESGSTISSDVYSSYKQLSSKGYDHKPKVFNPKTDREHLRWLHIIVSNAKALINGTFHGLDEKYLHLYLSEFCYRFNRRFKPFELFNRLLFSCTVAVKITYAELTA